LLTIVHHSLFEGGQDQRSAMESPDLSQRRD
jgi:hypothetical protein